MKRRKTKRVEEKGKKREKTGGKESEGMRNENCGLSLWQENLKY